MDQQGAAVVLVTQDPAVAARADRVLRLAGGQLVHDTGAAVVPVDGMPRAAGIGAAAKGPVR